MWKIAICDDEEWFCNETRRYLEQIARKLREEFTVNVFENAEQLLSEMPTDLDILLLDIKMCEMTGIDAARKIRRSNDKLCIIFITSMTEYALEGYEVHAFGFIKKPGCYAPLERNITEAIKRLSAAKNDSVAIVDKDRTITLRSSDIIFIEAYRHEVDIVTVNEKIKTAKPLSEIEVILLDRGFFRTHKSYIANMRHIRSIENTSLLMSDGSTILLSKHRKNNLWRALLNAAEE